MTMYSPATDAGGEHAPAEVLVAPERAHDQWLQQATLGVSPHGADGQEDGEHDAEEQRPEHGQAEQRRAREHARVEADLVAAEARDVLEELARAPRVEPAEADRDDDDDGEHPPAQRLAHGLAGDDEDVAHAASSSWPRAARYVSSSVERRRRTS